ncbi:MAG: ABC transporter permease subunit [Pseudomonadota bacterium]
MSPAIRSVFVPAASLLLLCAIWEALIWAYDVPNFRMASPSDIAGALVKFPCTLSIAPAGGDVGFWDRVAFDCLFVERTWQTLWRTVAGLAVAVVIGTGIGVIMGFSRIAREGLYPILVGFNAIPKATVVPIIALIFVGQHNFNTVMIAFMISFFPIAVSVSIGLSTLEPEYRDILRSLGASNLQVFWKIALPKTLPEFFGALKVAVTLAFIGTNLMEIVSPHGRGLGALFDSGRTSADYPLMFAVLLLLAALGILLFYIVVAMERVFAGWAERAPA